MKKASHQYTDDTAQSVAAVQVRYIRASSRDVHVPFERAKVPRYAEHRSQEAAS